MLAVEQLGLAVEELLDLALEPAVARVMDAKPNAFFTVNVVARKPEKNTPDTNPYLQRFLQHSAWRPKATAVFAGRIVYKRYSFWDRQVIRFIMWLTKGPTDPSTDVEFTDWAKVDAFGRLIAIVPQRPYLFTGTVASNLRYADPDAFRAGRQERCPQG